MHMSKIRTTITIDKELLQRAKKNHVPISSFLDVELRRYLAIIEGKFNSPLKDEMGLLRFELKSIAPEATRMPSYPTGPNLYY